MSDVASAAKLALPSPLAGDSHSHDPTSHICRAEIATGTNPLTWLSSRSEQNLCYWASREGDEEIAASGILVEVSQVSGTDTKPWIEQINSHLRTAADGIRFYGGVCFNPNSPTATEWQTLGKYRFIVPRFEAFSRNGSTFLACNFLSTEHDRLPELMINLQRMCPSPISASPRVLLHRDADLPDRSGWIKLVHRALEAINDPTDPLSKVVIARRTEATSAAEFTPQALLSSMSRPDDRSFRFLMQTRPGTAFISVTPERLFSLKGRSVHSEAIAGTRPRGETLEIDQRLQQELTNSAKDLLEHQIVHDAISAALSALCTETTTSEITILQLPGVQHLMSQLSGKLRNSLNAADLLDALHPTPAVGGKPNKSACRFLIEHELFDRGWYAAPIGWVGQEEATFAVGIRSALIDNGAVLFFTGNGVVTGSSPKAEWEELEAKIRHYFDPTG